MPRPGAVYFLVKILLRTLLKPIEKRIGPLCARVPPPMAESSIVKLLEARRNRVRRTPDVARPTLKGLRHRSGQARRTSLGVRRTSRDARQASGQARHTPKDLRRTWEEARPMPDDLRRGPGGAGHALRAVRVTPDDLPRTPQDERDMRQREMRNQGSARAWHALFGAPPNSPLECNHRSPTLGDSAPNSWSRHFYCLLLRINESR
jgi:hypothetical protein